MKAIKYPKIGQLKDVVYEVRRRSSFDGLDDEGKPIYKQGVSLPSLEFEGTVKLHGTNASVVVDDSGVRFQSRNRVLALDNDNCGFANFANDIDWPRIALPLGGVEVVIYGEWCGEGIQNGVAVSQLEKRFVIFSALVNGEWASKEEILSMPLPNQVETIFSAETWLFDIDFNQPQLSQNEIRNVTDVVEKECPYGKMHGVSGVGEGVVYKCVTHGWTDLMFKVKGEKHSKSKVKTLNEVDLKALTAANKLASEIMTVERMNQGLEYIKEMGLDINRRNLGPYLKHVVSDCIAEENLAISELGLETKQLGKPLSEIAKNYFMQVEQEFAA